MHRWLKRCLVLLALISINTTTYAYNIDQIIVFGDSLSDNGNTFNLTSSLNWYTRLVPIVPKSPPYFDGRFSNGEVWVENVAKNFNVPLKDYAYGGAWAESSWNSKRLIPYGLDTQVNMYLVGAVTDFHKDQHLYVIWAGGNDYLDGRDDADYATTNTVAVIKKQIDWLAYYGAKHFLVINIPDLGFVPDVVSKGETFALNASKMAHEHNAKLAKSLAELRAQYPAVQIVEVDIMKYFYDITANPEKYGVKNVLQACFEGGYYLSASLANSKELAAANEAKLDIMHNAALRTAYLAGKQYDITHLTCDKPDDYLYWDRVHPTRVAHRALGRAIQDVLLENDIHGM